MSKKDQNFLDKKVELDLTFYNLNAKATTIKSSYLLQKSIESLVDFVNSHTIKCQSA